MNQIRELYYLKAFGYDFLEQNFSVKEKFNGDFNELRATFSKCSLCHLSKKRKFCVSEDSQKKCKIMIVDSFISKSENESGKLLNSNKGKKLKEILLRNLGLTEQDFYMSYVLKCFSDCKSDNLALEQCLPYFLSEFELLRPSILVILGKDTFENIGFKNYKIHRGEPFLYDNSTILTTLSLEFIMRNPSYEVDFINDLQKIKDII